VEFTIDPDLGLPVRIELRVENCPLPTATPTPTSTPTATPTATPSPTRLPTKPPFDPPNTGETTEYIMLGIGVVLLLIFFVITLRERKQGVSNAK
jgi:LPXTG-motif cell wall-anchored protein